MLNKYVFRLAAAVFAVAGLSATSSGYAAEDEWSYGIGAGLSFLALDGDIGFAGQSGGVIVEVDLDNGDTMDMLESAFGFQGFANKGPWTINFGYGTLTLEDDDAGFDAEWDRVMAFVEAQYAFATTGNHRWSAVGGVRMTDHDWEFSDSTSEVDAGDDWTDAVIGLAHLVPIADNWVWTNRVDYGFGDSEGSYNLKTGVNWRGLENWILSGTATYSVIEYGDEGDIDDSDFYYYDVDEVVWGFGFAYTW